MRRTGPVRVMVRVPDTDMVPRVVPFGARRVAVMVREEGPLTVTVIGPGREAKAWEIVRR